MEMNVKGTAVLVYLRKGSFRTSPSGKNFAGPLKPFL
jgi:hypothetical protein